VTGLALFIPRPTARLVCWEVSFHEVVMPYGSSLLQDAVELREGEVRRISIPRTSVNKGKKRRKARSGVRWPLGYDLEVPSLVLIQRVACLVLNTGGDGSRVGLAALQRISRGKGGPLSVFVVIDTARR
jgi:hypothetical protein